MDLPLPTDLLHKVANTYIFQMISHICGVIMIIIVVKPMATPYV